jgi:hypothetical protein
VSKGREDGLQSACCQSVVDMRETEGRAAGTMQRRVCACVVQQTYKVRKRRGRVVGASGQRARGSRGGGGGGARESGRRKRRVQRSRARTRSRGVEWREESRGEREREGEREKRGGDGGGSRVGDWGRRGLVELWRSK